MSDFRDGLGWTGWDDGFPVCIDRVMSAWSQGLRHELPWRAMPRDDLTGQMRRIVVELTNASYDADGDARRHRIAAASREHGSFRQAQRCTLDDLGYDFALLCSAFILALPLGHWPEALAQDAVRGLVPDIRLARRAAARGFASRDRRPRSASS